MKNGILCKVFLAVIVVLLAAFLFMVQREGFQGSIEHLGSIVFRTHWETLDESIGLLINDDQQYHHPGFHTGQKFAQVNLEEMLSNIRTVKVLRRLKHLPRKEREVKCRELFARAFQAHTNAFRAISDRQNNPSLPQNKQSTWATQLTMCAAMYAAADSGQRETLASQFAQLDKFIAEQESPQEALWFMERYKVPDNRFQVNVLHLMASRVAGQATQLLAKVEEECNRANMKKKESTLVAPGGGVTQYTSYDWDSWDLHSQKEKQVTVVSNLRKIVLP